MTSTFKKSSQNDYINNLFKQESFNSKEVNIINLGHVLTTLQDTSSQLGQSLQRNVKSQLGSFSSCYKINEQVYEQGQQKIQEALSSSHNILLQDAKIVPKTIISNYLTTQSKFQQCEQTITSLQHLIKVSQQLDTVYSILTSQQQQRQHDDNNNNKIVKAIQQIFLILQQINTVEKNESVIAWQGLKQRAIQYRQWIISLVHDGLGQCIVFNREHTDTNMNINSSLTILSTIKLNGASFYLSDLLQATILLDIQHSELASIQRQIIKNFIDPFLSVQRTSGPSIQLSIEEKEEDGRIIKSLLYLVEYSPNTSNDEEVDLIKKHHDRCADAEKMLQHTDLIMQFIFNGMFNDDIENNSIISSLESLRQLFGHLLLPHVLDTLVTKAMVPTISLTSISLSDLPIALNDLDTLAKMAIHFEKQWVIEYAHLSSQDAIDLPLGKYVNHFDQHVAYQRRALLLNDARKIMLRKVYDTEEQSNIGKITQTPRIILTMIQQMVQEIQLLSSKLDKYPETATTLKNTIQEVIMLYITIMPSFHRRLFLQHASHAMVFRNDCYWLADNLVILEVQDDNSNILTKLRRLGDIWERIVIAQFTTNVDIILNKTEEWHQSGLSTDIHQHYQQKQQQQLQNKEVISLENAIEVIVHRINTFITNISSVIIQKQTKAFLISISDDVLKKIMDGILSMDDIAADTSRSMAQALNGLAQLATLFSTVIDNDESVSEVTLRQWIPHWQPFWMLKDMLDMTMADILDALYRGDLACFTHDQLTHLVCALFSDTPRRDETIRTIKSSDLSGISSQQSVIYSPMSSQPSSSKRSIPSTNPSSEQPIKRSFLERLLIPDDDVKQQQQQLYHTIDKPFTPDSSIRFNDGDKTRIINTSSDKGVDMPSTLKNSDQPHLPKSRFAFNEPVDDDGWNQNTNWSDIDNDDDKKEEEEEEEESNTTCKTENRKTEFTSTSLFSQQKHKHQNPISNKFVYDESLDDVNDNWGESEPLETLIDGHDTKDNKNLLFKTEQEVGEDDNGDKGLLNQVQQPAVISKFSFNETLDNENDGWDQDDLLGVISYQLHNNESTNSISVDIPSEKSFYKQSPDVSSKFEHNEYFDDNGWDESEELVVEIDNSDNVQSLQASNRSPSSSHSQEQTGHPQKTSVDYKMNFENNNDNHDVSGALSLITDEENGNISTSIKLEEEDEETSVESFNGQKNQRQQSTIRSMVEFKDSLLLEDGWDQSEPLGTLIESMDTSTKIEQQEIKQQNQPTIDNTFHHDDAIQNKVIKNDKYDESDLLDVNMDKISDISDIPKSYESLQVEEQAPKCGNTDLVGILENIDSSWDQSNSSVGEDNQEDLDMDLLEQGLYDPSRSQHQHLSSFDDEMALNSILYNEVIKLSRSELPGENIAIESNSKDMKLDPLQSTVENSSTDNNNKSNNVGILQPVAGSSTTDNGDNKSIQMDKGRSTVENDIKDNNENVILDQLESMTENITDGNDGDNESIKMNRKEASIEAVTQNIDKNDDENVLVLSEITDEKVENENSKLDLSESSIENAFNNIVNEEKNVVLGLSEVSPEVTTNTIDDYNENITLDESESLVESIVTYNKNENVKPEQSECGPADEISINVDNDNYDGDEDDDEKITLDQLEPTAENIVTESIEYIRYDQLKPTVETTATNNITNNIATSQSEPTDKNIIKNSVNANESGTELVSEQALPEFEQPHQAQSVLADSLELEKTQKDQHDSYDYSKLIAINPSNVNDNELIPYEAAQVKYDSSIITTNLKSDSTLKNECDQLPLWDLNDKKDNQDISDKATENINTSENNTIGLCHLEQQQPTTSDKFEINKIVNNNRWNNFGTEILENDMENKENSDSLKHVREAFIPISTDTTSKLLDVSKTIESNKEQNEVSTLQQLNVEKNKEDNTALNKMTSNQSESLYTGTGNTIEDNREDTLENMVQFNNRSTKHQMDEQLLQQHYHISNRFAFNDLLDDDGWEQDDINLNIKVEPVDKLSSKAENTSTSNIQIENEDKPIKGDELDKRLSTSETIISSSIEHSLRHQHGQDSIKSSFSFDSSNLVDDEDGWDQDNILNGFISNEDTTITPIMNVIEQKKVDSSQDQHHKLPALSSRFEFNDTLIDDDGWDQEDPLDIIINDASMNIKSDEQQHTEITQMKELQFTNDIDGWDQDGPLDMIINDVSINTTCNEQKNFEDIKKNSSQLGNIDDELIHSKILHSKIKSEISEGMSTKLERIKPNNFMSQQQQLSIPHSSITSDRFTFDGLSDDSGWDQDSGWLDEDIDDFILTSVDNTASSSPHQKSKQSNQITTKQDKQYDVTMKSPIEKNQYDTKETIDKYPIPTSSTTFAFNDDEEPVGWSDADEDIFLK